jgi:hypothetical protein
MYMASFYRVLISSLVVVQNLRRAGEGSWILKSDLRGLPQEVETELFEVYECIS